MSTSVDSPDFVLPVSALQLVVLDVSRIRPYEHNPRRVPNPEYARIKASIRADGLDQSLIVTQRPGETDYIAHAGGNTRLQILKELFDETGEQRFAEIPCVIRPWTREADVLLAHLRENDLRGELTFFDRALAVMDARRLLSEGDGEALTQAALADALQHQGYGLSQGLISQMVYAVERLAPLLPQALQGGMGRPQVAKIRALDRAACAIWIERGIDTQAQYDQVFETLCRRYDTADWDISSLRRALEAEIAACADISVQAVRLELEARLSGRSGSAPDSETGSPGSADMRHARSADSNNGTPLSLRALVASNSGSQRERLCALASRLAQRHGLGRLVQPTPDAGFGFVLQDVPDAALLARLDEAALAQVSLIWWTLAACSELTVAPTSGWLASLPAESLLRRALADQDAGLLFSHVWTPDPGQVGYHLWCRLDDPDWQDLLGLMDTYRTLRRQAATDAVILRSAT